MSCIPILPTEIINKILFTHKGFSHKTAILFNNFIDKETLYKYQYEPIVNFYQHLKDINFLKDVKWYRHPHIWFFNVSDIDSDEDYYLDYYLSD